MPDHILDFLPLKNKIKQEIVEILNQQGDLTLTGFLGFDSFKELAYGDLIWTLETQNDKDSNIVILQDINQDCVDAFNEFKKEKIVVMTFCNILTATADGIVYKLPLPKKRIVYKEPHWQPILVSKSSHFENFKTVQ